jgi:biopolymer transport protein TolR
LMDAPVANDELIAKLQGIAKQGFDERIYLRADKGIMYGRVAEVMASLTSAGYKKVALVTETDKH